MTFGFKARSTKRRSSSRKKALSAMLLAMSLCGVSSLAAAQATGADAALSRREDDASFANYKFRDGQTLPTLRLHYATFGTPHKNTEGAVDNAVLFLHWTNASSQALSSAEFQKALFAAGAPLDSTRYYVIIPDDIGHGQSSKPSNGLKASFPHYGYGDMVDLQHKLVVEILGIGHLHAVVGMSMGCMNAWQWAEAYPTAMDGIMPIALFSFGDQWPKSVVEKDADRQHQDRSSLAKRELYEATTICR